MRFFLRSYIYKYIYIYIAVSPICSPNKIFYLKKILLISALYVGSLPTPCKSWVCYPPFVFAVHFGKYLLCLWVLVTSRWYLVIGNARAAVWYSKYRYFRNTRLRHSWSFYIIYLLTWLVCTLGFIEIHRSNILQIVALKLSEKFYRWWNTIWYRIYAWNLY